MARKRIGLKDVRKLALWATFWDESVPGFGARRQASQAVSYILKYRTVEGRQRWLTIGRHGAPWTPEAARTEAKRLLGEVVKGLDPAAVKRSQKQATTISELCDLYLNDAAAGTLLTKRRVAKATSTVATDRGRVECHIKPLLGRLAVRSVTREDVDTFLHDVAQGKTARNSSTKKRKITKVRGGKGAASRTVGLLGAIFEYAIRRGMRPDNPVRGVTRFVDRKRDRRLTDAEFGALALGIERASASGLWPPVVAAVRFLALTGWRCGEVLGLKWEEIDLARRTATLASTKTGRSIRPLSQKACDVIQQFYRSTGFVFQAIGNDKPIPGFRRHWRKITSLGNISLSVTPHTMRHSFASIAGDLGYSETTIGALIGHKSGSVTSRYIHAADAVLLTAADVVADHVTILMEQMCRDPANAKESNKTQPQDACPATDTLFRFRRSK